MNVTTATLPLRSGGTIPVVGLGVWQSPRGATTRDAVATALRLGYRHVDTARIYGNEVDVGAAIRDERHPARATIFVTTKLWNDDQGYDSALRAFDASAKRLGARLHRPLPPSLARARQAARGLVARAREAHERQRAQRDRRLELPRPHTSTSSRPRDREARRSEPDRADPFLQRRDTARVQSEERRRRGVQPARPAAAASTTR